MARNIALDPSTVLQANPMSSWATALAPVFDTALKTGGGIFGSSSSSRANGTQGNTSVFSSSFNVGGGRASSDPNVIPTVSNSPAADDVQPVPVPVGGSGGGIGGINLAQIGAIVGIVAGVVVILKAVK